ncbi:uncharacterized protein LOC141620370 [Silene latifolia]|uniref:uncharacterized protein LOC141620370 n=1 Tax=Silene latifolia TaxID=37657 RepID=UPI003D782D3E
MLHNIGLFLVATSCIRPSPKFYVLGLLLSPDIISPNQGGFVKGRTIIENILICQDIVRLYNRKSVSPRCLMKVDLKKAYDSVQWDFLESMLHALNFPAKFIHLVMTCVRNASYSLVLNGVNFGYFRGAKGLRQGDPISPLLFTINMEYLSRILDHVTTTMKFKYHPLCGGLKLSHLLFADDLLLFSKGDASSIMILLRAFATFSVATGLQMNAMKSNIYFNGVPSSTKADILLVSGFVERTTPFKYPGVPIVGGGLSMQQIKVCDYIRSPMVSWEKVCSPKCEGGLGIRHSLYWNANLPLVRRHRWVYTKSTDLWVRWINHVYLKGQDWDTYSPKSEVSWSWKTICKVRDTFSWVIVFGRGSKPSGYTVSSGYQWLRQKKPLVLWSKIVWNSWSVPKHTFTSWLITREALPLKATLFQLGIIQDEKCLICGNAAETHSHLFQQCIFLLKVLKKVSAILHIILPATNLLLWIQAKPWAKVKKMVTIAWIQAVHYYIWRQRNQIRVDGFLNHPDRVVHEIRCIMRIRAMYWFKLVRTSREKAWLMSVSS